MRRALCMLALLALVSACGGGGDEVLPEVAPTPIEEPTTEPEPEPEPEPTAEDEAAAPLTGLPAGDVELDRPVLAFKIDNHRQAQPQSGIELADVVVNELVEGGMTRFIALFHSTDPGDVGPVRSGREVDALLMPAFEPVFGFSGAASEVVAQLRASGLYLRTEGDSGWFRRSRPGVAREHTLYATAEAQWEAAAGDLAAAVRPWPIDAGAPEGGRAVDGAELVYSQGNAVGWEWDGERFLRSQYGGPHVAESGERVGAANVVVARVEVGPGPRGGGTVAIEVVGEGEALVLRGGRVHEARWRKAAAGEQFEWLTPEGEPLPLAPGRTWVELVPTRGEVRLSGGDAQG